MRTVWARELILEKLLVEQRQQQQQQSSKMSPEKELLEFQKKISANPVTKMGIGSEDYLMESIQREYADSIIDSFAELAQVLQDWHDQSLAQSLSAEEKGDATPLVDEQVESGMGANAKAPQDSTVPRKEEEDHEVENKDDLLTQTKFCVFCGTKVPLIAAHCSSCGKKQPQM
jgi:hypothetical protein